MGFTIATLFAAFSFLTLPSFDTWIQTYNKTYQNKTDYIYRQNIYLSNLVKISNHNLYNSIK